MPITKLACLSVGYLVLAVGSLAAQQPTPTAPDSATVAAGKRLYQGRGLCASCHGMNGEGLLGPTTQLNAGKPKWIHHDGSLAEIVRVITAGIDADHSKSGQVMPPKGGSRLTEEQIGQVAAYIRVLHTRPLPK